MQRGTTDMDTELSVKLSDSEVADRGVSMARHMAQVERLRKKKADDAKSTQALIDVELDEAQRLGRVILESFEMRKQGDLTFEETQAALGKVAETAGEPRPSEPHGFIAQTYTAEGSPVLCETCGAEESDPVHDPNAPHVAVLGEQPEGEEKACVFCTRAVADEIHTAVATIAPVEPTFVCADCTDSGAALEASTHPKSEGHWFDAAAREVCANCRQVAIEAGRWPHVFEASAGRKGKNKCRHCELSADSSVHVAPDEGATAAATGDPAYDFDASEAPPAVIASAKAIDTPAEEPAEEAGGEA